ncbi:hypothetical protein KHA95_11375 [Bacillus sp. FJAT-50079]|nr:hypothetical protein [Bacillus sp. FJAT-50079]
MAKEYGINCPKAEEIMKTSSQEKEDLLRALQTIIPEMYDDRTEYKEWRVEVLSPMVDLSGYEKIYRDMAVHFCGENVANHSWFVRIRFPHLLPAQSASLGELFILKNNQGQWFPWFRYH